MQKIAARDSNQLPREESVKSGALFKRFVSDENLVPLRNTGAPIGQRLPMIMAINEELVKLLITYGKALQAGVHVEREVYSITAFVLKYGNLVWASVDELVSTLDRKDPKYTTRMAALEAMKSDTNEQVSGALIMLDDPRAIPGEVDRFAREITPHLPALIRRLAPVNQADAKQRLERTAATTKDPVLKTSIERILADLH